MFYSTLLIASIGILFVYVFYLLFKMLILSSLFKMRDLHQLKQGLLRTGTIVSSHSVSSTDKKTQLEIEVEFENLSRTLITQTLRFYDHRPLEHRFQVGKQIELRLNSNLSSKQWVFPNQIHKVSLNLGSLFFKLVFLGGYLYGGYSLFLWIWTLTGGQFDPKVNDQLRSAGHLELLGVYVLTMILARFFVTSGMSSQSIRLLIRKGIRTSANIVKYEKTGTRINDDPVIRFIYQFQDQNGNMITGKTTQIIDEMQIGQLYFLKTKKVLYLPEDSSLSNFEEILYSPKSFGFLIPFLGLIFAGIFLCFFINTPCDF